MLAGPPIAAALALLGLSIVIFDFNGMEFNGLQFNAADSERWLQRVVHPARPKIPFRMSFKPVNPVEMEGWDIEHLLDTPEKRGRAFEAAFSNREKASLARLRRKIRNAVNQNRTLIIGAAGGSFSSPPGAFPEKLVALLNLAPGTGLSRSEGGPGAAFISIAQGSSTFELPLYCGPAVYAMRASGSPAGPSSRASPPDPPDVWIVDFLINWPLDSHAGEQFTGFLAANLFDPDRSGSGDEAAAVLNAAVANNRALADVMSGKGFPVLNLWESVYSIQRNACDSLGIPMISFLHGLMGSLEDTSFLTSGKPSTPAPKMVNLTRALFKTGGTNMHYDQYGHRIHAELLFELFRLAATTNGLDEPPDPSLSDALAAIPNESTRLTISRIVGSAGCPKTLQCATLLNQGGTAIRPLAMKDYELRSHYLEEGRTDAKRTFIPLSSDAELVLPIKIEKGARTACPILNALNNQSVRVSFPGFETPQCTVTGWHTRSSGKLVPLYAARCGCDIPTEMADGKEHGIMLQPGKGSPQVAGIAVY